MENRDRGFWNPEGFRGEILFFAALVALLSPALVVSFPGHNSRLAAGEPVQPSGTRVSGPISGDVTWTQTGNPYWIEGTVELTAGSRLNILAGVTLRFNRTSALVVRGDLRSLGTAAEPVRFLPNATQPNLDEKVNIAVEGSFEASNTTMDYARLSTTSGVGAASLVLDRVRYFHGDPIGLDRVGSVLIKDSEFTFIPGSGITIYEGGSINVSYNTIRIETASPTFTGNAILIRRSPDARVVRNLIEGRFWTAINVQADRALVADNVVQRSSWGILVSAAPGAWTASDAIVAGNRIGDAQAGIGMFLTLGGTIQGNLVTGSTRSAGIILDTAQYANVTANEALINVIGLRLQDSSHVTVVGNTLRGNGEGIRVSRGESHRIFHNWLLGNTLQATDSSQGTLWDDGYPSAGNHWSEYVGDDVYQGPMQDIPGPDGIGDIPRPIAPNGVDRYPFYVVPAPAVPGQLTARATGPDVELVWLPAPTADDYLLFTADTPTGFDFSDPVATGNATTWMDAGAAASPGARYYVVRARNATWDRTGPTSNTAGKWTHQFSAGRSTMSIPLEPYPWVDYSQPGWIDTAGEFLGATGASSIAYMDAGAWLAFPGGGDPSRTLRLGEGYVATFPAPTTFTFTGLPASVIDYATWPPYPLAGFDPSAEGRTIGATIDGDNVTVKWAEIPGFGSAGSVYEVYYADAPWKLRGVPWTDYRLLATVPAAGAGTTSVTHVGALGTGTRWFYLVVPVQDGRSRGASTYGIGVSSLPLAPGYSTIGLPLQPYANGTYVATNVSSILAGPEFRGVLWFDPARGDWVAHAAWMPPGTYDTPFTRVMAVQVDVTVATRITFVGV